ncbi:MAG TPA: XdhC family protein [Gaiellaceae bacterium]|jgi:xanthine dehydrogenase accessory factor
MRGHRVRLLVYGAIDTANELCRLARLLGWHTVVADARRALLTPERIDAAAELFGGWPEDVYARFGLDRRTAVVLLTHEERFDTPACVGALASDAFYIGVLGSRRYQRLNRERLRAAGVGDEALARIHGPCGLDLGAESPAETALSILAEIVAVEHRAGGLPRSLPRQSGAVLAVS